MNDLETRFWSKVDKTPNGCWLWTRSLDREGYGRFSVTFPSETLYALRYKMCRANRVVWELFFGVVPNGLNVNHTCDVRACVNPSHLWLGTQKENIHDCKMKGRLGKRGRPKVN